MPFEDIDQRGPSASSHFFEGICFPSERQVGFQTPKATPENQVGMEGIKSMFADDASFPLEKLVPIEMQLGNCLELQHFTEKLCIGGAKGSYGFCKSSLMYRDQHPKLRSNLYMQQSSCCADGLQKTIIGGTESESSLFSSSFSDIYSRKLKLSGYDVPFHQSDNSVASHIKKESSQSCEEIEAQAIGSMLPDEDDLFSGMLDHLGPNLPACGSDEDFDLFSSGGGMELEGDNKSRVVQRTDTTGQILKGRALSERSIGERPSRTLFVRNINGNVEDSELKTLFEQYGNIQTLYTACKHHGFIVICFHEIRAAQNALKSLQNKTLKQKKLDIHYLIPKKNPSDEANWGPIMAFNFDPSAVQQFGLFESSEFQEGKKYADQVHHGFHSHSFPEHLDNLSNSTTPWESLNSIRNMSSNVGLMRREGTESRYIHGVSPNGQLMEQCRRVVGSNSYNQHTANNSSIWGKSLPYVNGFQEHTLPKSPGFPQPLPHLSDTTSALHHHMGSAPTVYPSPNWDRRYAYSGESPQASSYEMGSLGSIFSHVGGNSMDINTNVGQQFHQQMGHAFPERKSVIQMPVNFEAPNGRLRSLSHRRSDTNFNNVDKKQYELDIDRILRGDDSRTTLMIKNIPNKYTSKMLLAAIDENCRGSYDFIYLPIDFKNKCNVGYAFINMIDPQAIIPFHQAFNGKKWEKFNSEKVASLAYARIQGKAALIVHFQNSSLMNEDKRCRPILFQTTGPNAGDQEPFPMGCSKYDREKTNSIPVVMRRITT